MPVERGDRIEVVNLPADLPQQYHELYINGVVDLAANSNGLVCFYTGNVSGKPFFDGEKYEVSGCGNACKPEALRFLRRGPATFWRWKDSPRAGGGVDYTLDRNYWIVDYSQLL